jgi:ABC-type antimicrobial peptide transport system permease subunit
MYELNRCVPKPPQPRLEKSLFGLSWISVPVFAGAVAILALTGGLATLVPAVRTARIDPLRALRQE